MISPTANVIEVYMLANTSLVVKKAGRRNIGSTLATIKGSGRTRNPRWTPKGNNKFIKSQAMRRKLQSRNRIDILM